MKKLFITMALVISASALFAQAAPQQKPEQKKEQKKEQTRQAIHKEKCDFKDCCMMKDGKMVRMQNGKEMPMTEDLTLENGAKVTKEGMMIHKDGKQQKLRNGDCVDMHGMRGRMEEEKKKEAPAKK